VAGIDAVHVPYKGSGPLMTDLVGGHIHVTFETLTATSKLADAGRLRPIAVASERRSPLMPTIPTTSEAGFGAVVGGSWVGLLAPANTPPAILSKVSQDVLGAFRDGLSAALTERGLEPAGTSAEEYRAFIGSEMKKWAQVIKRAGIQPE
jgi:tripartite-type tricarboxylate transporter receptor subunit TctC